MNVANCFIECSTSYSCANITVNVSSDSLRIQALDSNALTNSSINAFDASNLDILCSSSPQPACNHNAFYFPYITTSNFSELQCHQNGCGALDLYVVDGMDTIFVEVDPECECDSVSDCISRWNIYCDDGTNDTFGGHSIFNGTSCSGPCCGDIVNETFDSFLDFVDMECNDTETTEFMSTDIEEQNDSTSAYEFLMDILIIVGGTGCLCLSICVMFPCLRRRQRKEDGTQHDDRTRPISQYMQDSVSMYKPPELSMMTTDTVTDNVSQLSAPDSSLALTELLGKKSVKPHIQ